MTLWTTAVQTCLVLCAMQGIIAQTNGSTGSSASSSTSSTILAVSSISIPPGATKESLITSFSDSLAEKDCKMSNGFEKSKCGEKGKSNVVCCGSRQACVGPVTVKLESEDVELYTCSEARHLSGTKAVKILIIPIFFLLMDICFIVFMVWKLNVKSNHITKVCIAIIAVSWPLFLTAVWYYGVWAGFLAVFVAFLSNTRGFPWWIYRLAWAMQLFQLVLLFGPNETFHVPIFNQTLAGSSTELVKGSLAMSEGDCSQHFENYFGVLSLESLAKEADPDRQYNGLCTFEWLGFVQGVLLLQGIIVMVLVLLSAHLFLSASGDGKGAGLVQTAAKVAAPEANGAKVEDDFVKPFSYDAEKAK